MPNNLAVLLKFPLQPARSSELTISLVAGFGLDLLLLDCGRIVPALCHSQPVLRHPQQGGTHRLVLSAVCGVKTCSCTTPIFLAPTRHNEDPDRHYKRKPPLECPTERVAGKWPRAVRPAGPGSEGTCNGVRSPARVSNWHL